MSMGSSHKREVALDELMPLFRQTLAEGRSVCFAPRGVSMLPMLRQGMDTVTISPIEGKLKKYDLPLYQRDNGKYVLHRVIRVADTYTCDQLKATSTDEFMTALDSALAMCSAEGFKFSQLPVKQREIARYMSETLDEEWRARRGIEIVSVALAKVTPDEDSRKRIEEFDTNVMHAAPDAMAGGMAYAQMRAMRDAANNSAGAMTGFMGMGMAAGAMGVRGQETLLDRAEEMADRKAAAAPAPAAAPAAGRACPKCGTVATGKFCPECGEPIPAEPATWTCTCGRTCTGKFCADCGAAKPDGYTCTCGYKADAPFKFCPECGKRT